MKNILLVAVISGIVAALFIAYSGGEDGSAYDLKAPPF
jgi:hypothetical protein